MVAQVYEVQRLNGTKLPQDINEVMCATFGLQELKITVQKGTRNKFPGIDGITHEFYIVLWDTINFELIKIYNTLLQRKYLTHSLMLGIIVCFHKV